jgi:spore coat protein CotH
MGMNKRFVSKENLIEKYRNSGMAGVEDYLKSADALIMVDELSSTVVEYFGSEMIDDSERWNEISRLISFESIKHGYS